MSGSFYLWVPANESTQNLRRYLNAQAQPAASYHKANGRLSALQWRLSSADFRPLYLATPRHPLCHKDDGKGYF